MKAVEVGNRDESSLTGKERPPALILKFQVLCFFFIFYKIAYLTF